MAADPLAKKLKTLIAFRVFFVTVLLGTFFAFKIGYEIFPFSSSVLHLVVFLYALSIAYSLLLGKVNSRTLAYVQLGLDSVAVVALIFLTGGIASWFSSLMLLVVIAASIVVGKKAGYFTAIFLSILYGSLVDLQFYGLLPIPRNPLLNERDFLYNIFSHIIGLYLTAYLVGHLMTRMEKKDTDIEDLTLFAREVIENTPGGLFTTDLSGRILVFNRAAEEITGLRRAEVHGRAAMEVFPFMGLVGERKSVEEVADYGGERKVIGLTVSRMRDAKGSDTGFIGVFQDLTELRRMAEEIKQKEQWAAIGELSANIAHEIRNPLASLKGAVEMLREGAASPEQKERLMSIAISEMDRLNRIIADFLIYSRPSALDMQDCDLGSILDRTLDLIGSREPQNVAINRSYQVRLMVKADPLKLEQVFLNLGINALDAMPGGGELYVGAALAGDFVEVTFRDTGEGIAPADQKKVFYPFFTTKVGGTGLGLSIAHRIVEDHRGRITLRSAPGAGTTFRILVPRNNATVKG